MQDKQRTRDVFFVCSLTVNMICWWSDVMMVGFSQWLCWLYEENWDDVQLLKNSGGCLMVDD